MKFLIFFIILITSVVVFRPVILPPRENSNLFLACNDVNNLYLAIKLFRTNKYRVPKKEEGLQALVKSKIIPEIPIDPWGNAYQYVHKSDNEIDIISYGNDGKKGGKHDAEDIYYYRGSHENDRIDKKCMK